MKTQIVTLLEEGTSLHMAGRLSEAEDRYRSVLKEDDRHAVAHNNLGFLLLQKGLYQDSINEYRRLITISPEYSTAYTNFGQALLMVKEYDLATEVLLKAIELDPEDLHAHNALAKCYMLLGQHLDAEISLRQLFSLREDDDTLLNLAWCLISQGKLDEAGNALGLGGEGLKRNARFHSLWGMIYFATNNFGMAIFCFRQSLGLEPENIDNRNSLAASLLRAGEGNEARIEMQRVLLMQPGHIECLNNLGVLELAAGEYNLSLEYFDRVLQIETNDAKAMYYKAMISVHFDRRKEAHQLLENVVTANNPLYSSKCLEILEFLNNEQDKSSFRN